MKMFNTFSEVLVAFLRKHSIRPIEVFDVGIKGKRGYVYIESVELSERVMQYNERLECVL